MRTLFTPLDWVQPGKLTGESISPVSLRGEILMKMSRYNIVENIGNELLIYNCLTTGFLKLDKSYKEKYEMLLNNLGNESNCLKDLIGEMRKGEMIVNKELDEAQRLILFNRISRFNGKNLSLTIAPTLECNFSCPYCYEEGYRHNTMNASVKEAVVSFTQKHLKYADSLGIMWYGGEPLLSLDIIEDITNKINEYISINKIKYHAGIVTNGYLFNKYAAKKMKELNISQIQITLDGDKESHDKRRYLKNHEGTFDTIMTNIIENADEIDIDIRINIDKTNLHNAIKLLDVFENENLKNKIRFYLAPVEDITQSCTSVCLSMPEYSKEEIFFYSNALDKGFKVVPLPRQIISQCGAVSLNSYVIDPLGDLYKCWNHIGQTKEKVGDIFSDIKFESSLNNWLMCEPFNNIDCIQCDILPLCMGGCPYHFLKGKRICRPIKYNLRELLLLFYKMKQFNQELNQ